MVRVAPQQLLAVITQAQGLASTGAPPSAVFDALARLPRTGPAALRSRLQLASAFAWDGRFDEAIAEARAADADAVKTSDPAARSRSRALLVDLLAETGRRDEAVQMALDFLERRTALSMATFLDDSEILRDGEPQLIALLAREKAIAPATLERWRSDWLATHAGVRGVYRRAVWIAGYATTAQTTEAAREAMRVEREFGAPFLLWSIPPAMAEVGHVRLLAGDAKGAVSELDALARTCDVLTAPVLRMQALAWLGDARAELGDRAGACAAWRRVLSRWGTAHGRSLTVEATRAKLAGCTE
jgi:hypothetical protein